MPRNLKNNFKRCSVEVIQTCRVHKQQKNKSESSSTCAWWQLTLLHLGSFRGLNPVDGWAEFGFYFLAWRCAHRLEERRIFQMLMEAQQAWFPLWSCMKAGLVESSVISFPKKKSYACWNRRVTEFVMLSIYSHFHKVNSVTWQNKKGS